MSEQGKTVQTRSDVETRADWVRPAVRRLEAGEAEASPSGTTDTGVLTS